MYSGTKVMYILAIASLPPLSLHLTLLTLPSLLLSPSLHPPPPTPLSPPYTFSSPYTTLPHSPLPTPTLPLPTPTLPSPANSPSPSALSHHHRGQPSRPAVHGEWQPCPLHHLEEGRVLRTQCHHAHLQCLHQWLHPLPGACQEG